MKQNFTNKHLLRFLYKETSVSETLAIQEALNDNYGLYETYSELKWSYRQLPKAKFSPSKKSIQNILAYSQNTEVSTSH